MVGDAEEEPVFQDLAQFFPAGFDRFRVRPDALKVRDRREEAPVLIHLVGGMPHRGLNVLCQHWHAPVYGPFTGEFRRDDAGSQRTTRG